MAPLAVFSGSFTKSELPTAVEIATLLQDSGFTVVVIDTPSVHAAFEDAGVAHREASGAASLKNLLTGIAEQLSVLISPLGEASLNDVDVGCHSLIRASANNYHRIAVFVDLADLKAHKDKFVEGAVRIQDSDRRALAIKAFQATAAYDQQIAEHLSSGAQRLNNVLVVGGGGREHAISWKLAQSSRVAKVFVAPGNGGTGIGSPKLTNVAIAETDHKALVAFCKDNAITLCVVGPEAPLIDGLADTMTAAGIPCFGPSQAAAVLEASKAFSKDFMARHGIKTARYANFTSYEKAAAHVNSIDYPIVVKASGIAAGKGVLLPATKEEAVAALKEMMVDRAFGSAGDEVVIEERLEGEEVSLLAFTDGHSVAVMPGAQDHKRIFDFDEGPNTGGMGAYAPAPALTPEARAKGIEIIQKSVTAMAKEGKKYVGVLYAGLMLTKDGVSVLEYNCRFGDPETQVLLVLLESDLFSVMMACVQGKLNPESVLWKEGAAATVVAASEGYPGSYPKGKAITGLDKAAAVGKEVVVFHAGTKLQGHDTVTSGGRVLAVSAYSKTFQEALTKSYQAINQIKFEGIQFRSDIGSKAVLRLAPKVKIGVLGSTRGSSLQPVIDAIEAGQLNATISVVISNKTDAPILERAKKHQIPAVGLTSKGLSREDFDAQATKALEEHDVDLVLLIGYMRILSGQFCKTWENRCLNVHPSLLPDFAGGMDLEVHSQVIKAKKTVSGCTVHFVTEEVDAGPIAVQLKCPVLPEDTPESLKARVQPLEGTAFIRAIQLFQRGKIGSTQKKRAMVTYKDAGVDIIAGDTLVERIKPYCKATRRVGCDANLGGFGGLFDLNAAGYGENTVLVACNDGVGTKLKVALLANKHDTVGIDLVAMSVNDLIVQGAEPLLFLDYYACGKLELDVATAVIKGIAEGCVDAGCGLIGGETAEMPSMYHDGDYDLAGFALGAVQRDKILPKALKVGDIVFGLPSSGLHSNGYSLIRKLVELSKLSYQDNCPFEEGKSLGEALLVPTRIYVKALMPAIKDNLISALAHITGGGLTENIPRVLTDDIAVELNASSWTLAPVFKWLQQQGNLPDAEMSKTFNCGIGMVVVVSPADAAKVSALWKEQGEQFFELGKVVPRGKESNSPQVVINGALRYA